MNHTLNTPSASWSVARFPKEVQNYAPTVKEPAMFSALRNGGGNVALNAYAAQAVVAWMKGEHADMALVDVGGSTYAAELPQADGTVLIATVNRPDPNGKTVRLRAAIAKPVVGTADYTFTSLPTIDRSCEVNLAPIYLCLLPSRKTALLSFLQENGFAEDSIDGQLWFFKTEIESSERAAWNAIKDLPNTSDGAYEAGRLWCLKFERPRDGVGDSVERGNLAQNTYWPAYGGR